MSSKGIVDDISFDSVSSSGSLSVYLKINTVPMQYSLEDLEVLKYERRNQINAYNQKINTIKSDIAFHERYDSLYNYVYQKYVGKEVRLEESFDNMDFGKDYVRWLSDDGKDGPYGPPGRPRAERPFTTPYNTRGDGIYGFAKFIPQYSKPNCFVDSIELRTYSNNYWIFFASKENRKKLGLSDIAEKEEKCYYVRIRATDEYKSKADKYDYLTNDTLLIPLTNNFDKYFIVESDYQAQIEEEKRQYKERKAEEQRQEQEERKKYIAELSQEYGARNARIIADGDVRIGFTKDMCIEAWGSPMSINTITTNRRTREQWVYGIGWYLYFEGDKLVGITKRKN